MEQRISLITLGVADLTTAREFYRRLGWSEHPSSADEVAFFQAGPMVFGLWDRASLAQDSGVDDPGGWGGTTLAHNVRDPGEVDRVIDEAREAGAGVTREPAATPWGGYSGAFVDPDGHTWEVAHNPYWSITDRGETLLG